MLEPSIISPQSSIRIAGSKSETNRLLLLQALYPQIQIHNVSDSDDSQVMVAAFEKSNTQQPTPENLVIDIHHAGTAMRFLTAYFAIAEGKTIVLTGSDRMKERPIKVLVDALRALGADISYEGQEGFPPLKITGKKLSAHKVSLPADVSSQYISALLLIAPKLENGLELMLEGQITSRPYIEMTLGLLNQIEVETAFTANQIIVKPTAGNPQPTTITIESDWSSASYYYSLVALSEIGTQITLSTFKKDSLQGDSVLAKMYTDFGVETVFHADHSISITKTDKQQTTAISLNLNNTPDLAQTIAVTCLGLGVSCQLLGLHTLKIKETDRLQALKNELAKLGAQVSITNDSLHLQPASAIQPNIAIATCNDHRMAMAFAPLALKVPVIIQDAAVVSKSYPAFWDDLKGIGFKIFDTLK